MLELCGMFHRPPSELSLTSTDEVFLRPALEKRNELRSNNGKR